MEENKERCGRIWENSVTLKAIAAKNKNKNAKVLVNIISSLAKKKKTAQPRQLKLLISI